MCTREVREVHLGAAKRFTAFGFSRCSVNFVDALNLHHVGAAHTKPKHLPFRKRSWQRQRTWKRWFWRG